MDDREHGGIADQHLVDAARGRIAAPRRLDIGIEPAPQRRQLGREALDDRVGAGIDGMDRLIRHRIDEFEPDLSVKPGEGRLQRLFDKHMLIMRPHEVGAEPQRIEGAAQRADDLRQVAARRKSLAAIFGIMAARIAPLAAYLGELGGDRGDAARQFGRLGIDRFDHRPSRCQNNCALTRGRSAAGGDQDGCGSGGAPARWRGRGRS